MWESMGAQLHLAKNLPVEYLKAVVEDDMYRTDGIKRDFSKVNSLLHSLARNESTVVSIRTLRRDMMAHDEIEISVDTITEYLNIFDRLFLLDEQPAFDANLRSSRRVLKAPKRHFADVSLAVAALAATPEMLLGDIFGCTIICETEFQILIYVLKETN